MTAAKKAAAKKAATEPAVDTAAELEEKEPALAQFPSLAGHPDVEVAERSADVEEDATNVHRKVFVIPRNGLVDQDYSDAVHDAMHAANIDGMRQEMVLNGLRPTEDGHFAGAEPHADGQSVCLAYEVAAVPAAVATPEQNVVAVTVDDQHRLDQKTDGK